MNMMVTKVATIKDTVLKVAIMKINIMTIRDMKMKCSTRKSGKDLRQTGTTKTMNII